jgi:DNA-binding transcriptional LysR family regulator
MCNSFIMEVDDQDGFDARLLRTLAAIRDERSLTRAAARLGYAQSAVSHQLAALERSAGLRLVERSPGRRAVALTEAGELVAAHAERMLGELAVLRADLRALRAGEAGSVRVGFFQSAGANLLPTALRACTERWPRVRVELVERDDDAQLSELLLAGRLEVCFSRMPTPDDRLEGVALADVGWVLLAPATSLLGRKRRVALRDLHGQRLVAYVADVPAMREIEAAWRRAGAEPDVVFRTNDNMTLQGLVGAGLGCAVVPALSIEPGLAGDAVVRELADGPPPFRIGLAWMRGRPLAPAARAFVEVAVAALTALEDDRVQAIPPAAS